MKFADLQKTVQTLVAGAASFNAATIYDFGFQKADIEDALDMKNGQGYVAGVWPVAHAQLTSEDASGEAPLLARVVVRLEISPLKLKAINAAYVQDNTQPDVGMFINGLIQEIIDAVLADPPEAGGTKFEMARDCFEMVNFDEGLIAFHLRFNRFCVL